MKELRGSRPNGRILALILWVILGLTACKKSETQPQLAENKAGLILASSASDGPPVDQLVLDSTHEALVPINKKDDWPQTQVGPTAVAIRFIDTGKTFTENVNGHYYHLREVYIVSFRVL